MTDKTNESPFRPYISPTAYNTSDFSLDTPGLIEQTNQTIQDHPEHDFFEGKAFEQEEEQEGEQIVEETAEVIDPSTANVTSDIEKPVRAQLDYTIPINAQGFHEDQHLVNRNGQQMSIQKIEAFNLRNPLIDLEKQVRDLLEDDMNLEKQLEAFNLIRGNQQLIDRLDRNKDGQYTFADMFYTSRWNGGKGITAEQDAKYTQEWINGVTNKSFGRRLKQLLQSDLADAPVLNYSIGFIPSLLKNKNASKVLLDRRRLALSPLSQLKAGENIDETLAKGYTEWISSMLSLPEQLVSFVKGGDFGGHDAKLDDLILKHKDPSSFGFALWNPSYRQGADGIAQEFGYWIPEAALTALTLGAGSSKLLKHTKHLPKAQRLFGLRTARFINPSISTRGIFTGKKTVSKLGKIKNFVGTSYKSAALETFKGSMLRDLSENNFIETYNNYPEAKKIVDSYPDAQSFGRSASVGIQNPLFKRYAYWLSETDQDARGAAVLWGLFGKVLPFGFRQLARQFNKIPNLKVTLNQVDLNKFKITTKKDEWSVSEIREQLDAESLFNQRNQINNDIVEAGKKQLNLFNEGADNPYFKDGTPAQNNAGYGAYAHGDNIPGQGIAQTRGRVTNVLNDVDEIELQVIKKPGSTDALLSPLSLHRAKNDGVSIDARLKLAQEYADDPLHKRQISVLAKNSRTLGGYSEGTLRRIQNLESRDGGRLSPTEYWGEDLFSKPLSLKNFNEYTKLEKFWVDKLEVQDALNNSLLFKVRDLAGAATELKETTDIFATDGPMSRLTDNLTVGLAEVKKTRFTAKLIKKTLNENNGKITASMVENLNKQIETQGKYFHKEAQEGVKLMHELIQKTDNDELAASFLDFFRMSSDLHNWSDINSFIHKQLLGGTFNNKKMAGALQEEFNGVMLNSILSGPKTPARALVGTATNTYYNALTESAGAYVMAGFGGDVLSRQIAFAKLKSLIELVPNAYKVFRANLDSKFKADFSDLKNRYSDPYDRTEIDFEFQKQVIERNGTDGEKMALGYLNTARTLNDNKLAGWGSRALSAIDPTFKWLLANTRALELAHREVAEAAGGHFGKLDAEQFAKIQDKHYNKLLDMDGNIDVGRDSYLRKQYKEVTLTSEVNGVAKRLDDIVKEYPLLKPFYLFARTGINGLNFSYKNTPLLGALHKESFAIMSHKGTDFSKLAKYGIENAQDLQNAKNIFVGRQAVGTAVVSSVAMMYQAGLLTGNGPADRQTKEAWKAGGWKPNHIYLGNVGFNYTSLEPFNIIFSSIADVGDNIELMGTEWAGKRMQAVGFVIGRGVTGKSYLSGLDQLMQILQNPFSYQTPKAVMNIMNNSLPLAGMRNEFGKWINPHMKELNSSMWDSIRNRNLWAEGLAQKPLPNKHDILNGKPINNWNIIGRSFNAVSPIQIDIRSQSPGRRFLLDSNFDLKTSTYSHNGYSLVEENHIRSHMQNEMGNAKIRYRGKTFDSPEAALDYISTLPDIKISLQKMKENVNHPERMYVNPKEYPHNIAIENVLKQARTWAWNEMNQPTHPAYNDIQRVISEKDGENIITRDTKKEILELGFPQQFPRN
tara:strand:+ start:2597 stop:7318 length:4722 start_codon:yes stop_codon:yes gene_type:complete